jgi:hypothetical protein
LIGISGRASRITLNLSFTLSHVTIATADLESCLSSLEFDPEIPCVCKGACSHQEHAAAYWVTLSCGCHYSFCRRALSRATARMKVRSVDCRRCGTEGITVRRVTRI